MGKKPVVVLKRIGEDEPMETGEPGEPVMGTPSSNKKPEDILKVRKRARSIINDPDHQHAMMRKYGDDTVDYEDALDYEYEYEVENDIEAFFSGDEDNDLNQLPPAKKSEEKPKESVKLPYQADEHNALDKNLKTFKFAGPVEPPKRRNPAAAKKIAISNVKCPDWYKLEPKKQAESLMWIDTRKRDDLAALAGDLRHTIPRWAAFQVLEWYKKTYGKQAEPLKEESLVFAKGKVRTAQEIKNAQDTNKMKSVIVKVDADKKSSEKPRRRSPIRAPSRSRSRSRESRRRHADRSPSGRRATRDLRSRISQDSSQKEIARREAEKSRNLDHRRSGSGGRREAEKSRNLESDRSNSRSQVRSEKSDQKSAGTSNNEGRNNNSSAVNKGETLKDVDPLGGPHGPYKVATISGEYNGALYDNGMIWIDKNPADLLRNRLRYQREARARGEAILPSTCQKERRQQRLRGEPCRFETDLFADDQTTYELRWPGGSMFAGKETRRGDDDFGYNRNARRPGSAERRKKRARHSL